MERTVRDIFVTGYRVGTERIKKFSFSFVEKMITEVIHRGLLNKMLSQGYNRWSQLDTFMQVLVVKIACDSGLVTLAAALVLHCVVNVVGKKLKQESQVSKRISSPPERSHQIPLVPNLPKSPKLDPLAAIVAIVKTKYTNIPRITCVVSVDKPIDRSHLVMQIVL